MSNRTLPFTLSLVAVLIAAWATAVPLSAQPAEADPAAPAEAGDPSLQPEQPPAPGTEALIDPTEPPAAGVAEPGEAIEPEDLEVSEDAVSAGEAAEGAEGDRPDEEPAVPEEDLAADFYLSRCAGCHTIGEGELSGPDLEPSTGWPAPDLAKAIERMEKNVGPMTDEQVGMLVDLMHDEELKPRLSAARERQVAEMAATLEPPSPDTGEALFHGDRPLRHGGLSCAACHRAPTASGRVRGGTLAADLTDSHERLGEQALFSAAETPGFPLMRASYRDRPVTRQEAVHLVAYLEEVSARAADGAVAGGVGDAPPVRFALWGTAVAALFLVAMVWLYRGRNRGVRAAMVREAHSR